tara:strand:+ start:2107 stop:2946 length:840 start_codon:yes stop_codon:yes gene_type:complete
MAAWAKGIQNMQEEPLDEALKEIDIQMRKSFLEENQRDETPIIRPSSGTVCATQSYYIKNGFKREPMPPTIMATFVMGHFVHEITYAALRSGLPDGVNIDTEISCETGFPEGCNKMGTADLVLTIEDESLLPEMEVKHILGDVKTMTGFGFRGHKSAGYDQLGSDCWGHVSQLSTYSHSPTLMEKYPGIEKAGALLIAANKESPQMGIWPRHVAPRAIAEARERTLKNIHVSKDEHPGADLFDKYGSEVAFYCGASGRKGYCPYVKRCQEERRKSDYAK